ncbi:MAG: hypothetical protein RI897_2111 [Verrucomicrobiota bacterium]|jgi:hypothetical protein
MRPANGRGWLLSTSDGWGWRGDYGSFVSDREWTRIDANRLCLSRMDADEVFFTANGRQWTRIALGGCGWAWR